MEELKKTIIDNLYRTNFYEALKNIKQLEVNFPNKEEILFFYYYLYDLMSWVSKNKQDASYKKIQKSEVKYQNTNLTERDIFNGILDYWTVKSEDWEYEQEVRLLHYGDKQKIHYTFDVSEAIEKNIIALQIESIAFGLKFQHEASIKPVILEIEKKQKRKINLFKANQSKQKLVLEEVNEEK